MTFPRMGLLAALALVGCGPWPRTHSTPLRGGGMCTLIDTDTGLDDLRAIAALTSARRVVGVVATAGITSPEGGANALRWVLSQSDVPVVVGVGAASSNDRRDDWVAREREVAEGLNGVVPHSPVARTVPLVDAVLRWTHGCDSIEVVMLGPWSSFARYRRAFGDRLTAVYAQGPDPTSLPEGARAPFNCRYDLAACRDVPDGVLWVSLPIDAPEVARFDMDTIVALPPSGLTGAVRTVLQQDPGAWLRFSMAEDVVALRALFPRDFVTVGRNDEPAVSVAVMRHHWMDAVRSAPVRAPRSSPAR